ncbi:MAG: DUF6892 domain-containing protein [Maricaulaceae bacterium]
MFKFLKKNKDTASPTFVISCTNDAITIDGKEIRFPVHLDDLIDIFGEPTRREHHHVWNVIWDNAGVYCSYGSWDNILYIMLLTSREDRLEPLPYEFFWGEILVDGKPCMDTDFDEILLGRHAVKRLRYNGTEHNYAVYLGMNHAHQEDIPADKYVIETPNEDIIEFTDFNFKLAVIEELMFSSDYLKPRFDLHEFADWYSAREIDLEEEGYDLIPEVTAWFKALPIPKRLAKHVTEIYQDGGNEIYMQMINFWDGEDGRFDIQSAADAKHFPKLKKVTIFDGDGSATLKVEFETLGIKVDYL